VRIWVDITDASHVVFFAPIVRRLEDDGHTVTLTARRFAGADLVLRRYGLGGVLTTGHRGGSLGTRAVGLVNRTAQLLGSASSGHFDVAVGSHASDFALTAWTLGIPQMTLLDDERLRRSNAVNVRLVDEVAVPDAVSPATLAAIGVPPHKLFRYPGFKEEYYLYDFRPEPDLLKALGVDRRRVVGVVRPDRPLRRTAAVTATPTASETALLELVPELLGRRNVTLVVVARDEAQQRRFQALSPPGERPRAASGAAVGSAGRPAKKPTLIVPDGPVDGVGLIATADFVLAAGGAMTREAAALGTPAYTVSLRPPAAVDAALLADGRLRRVTGPDDIAVKKKDTRTAGAAPRDPRLFVERLLRLAHRASGPSRLGRLTGGPATPPGPPGRR
jgi:hypothetical protein